MDVIGLEIGNTSVHLAVLQSGAPALSMTFPHETLALHPEMLLDSLSSFAAKSVFVSSVAPEKTDHLLSLLKQAGYDVHVLCQKCIAPFVPVRVHEGVEVGIDLLLDVLAVKEQDAIIIDLGTCNKVIHKKEGAFEGVAISPGFSMSLNSIGEGTELVKVEEELPLPQNAIGKNTLDALSSGVLLGGVYGLLALADHIDPKRALPRYLAGGNALRLASYFKDYIIEPRLGLDGLLEAAKRLS